MNKPIFVVKNLDYIQNKELLLKIKNFEIHRGACYMFSGEMASGKSLLMSLLTKKIKKYSGDIIYDNTNLKSMSNSVYHNDISIVTQDTKKPFFNTVHQYIYKYISKKNDQTKTKKFTDNIIKNMNLKSISNLKVRHLTPSQFRWVDLAAKVGSNSKVMFIDEIEQHLSKENAMILSKLLYRKCNYDGVSLICTSQNPDIFKNLSSVVITLKHGRISSLRSRGKKRNS